MLRTFAFTCSRCREVHEGSPSFGYLAPYQYDELTEAEKKAIASLSDDFCVIQRPKQTDRFIRTILEIPIHGTQEPFLWGVWVSLSETSFEQYRENFDSNTYQDRYFGWFCNRLPYYSDSLNLKTQVIAQPGGQRPRLQLEPSDHDLTIDHQRGISWEKAVEIAQVLMHGNNA